MFDTSKMIIEPVKATPISAHPNAIHTGFSSMPKVVTVSRVRAGVATATRITRERMCMAWSIRSTDKPLRCPQARSRIVMTSMAMCAAIASRMMFHREASSPMRMSAVDTPMMPAWISSPVIPVRFAATSQPGWRTKSPSRCPR